MMHKTKTAKFSLAVKIASILTCVSVMAVGFASWLILNPTDPVDDQSGSFSIQGVEEAQFKFNNLTWENSAIKFGRPAGDSYTGWFRPTTDMDVENLTATLSFTLDSDNDNVNLNDLEQKVYITFAPADASKTAFDAAVTAHYITAAISGTAGETAIGPASYTVQNGKIVVEISTVAARSLDVTLNFNFGWGTAFGSQNPYTYFNGLQGGAATNGTAAKNALEAMQAINTVEYTVKIGTTAP